jgi:outer membrane protein insertion porin family
MAQYYPQQQQPGYGPQAGAQNLQFFPSSYASVSGHTTPSQASYGAGFGGAPNPSAQAYPGGGYGGFGSPAGGVSGRMGEQGGLRTGWLAAFGTEGYDGEPPLLEELGVNFEHIRTKVSFFANVLFSGECPAPASEHSDRLLEDVAMSTSCEEIPQLSSEILTIYAPRL